MISKRGAGLLFITSFLLLVVGPLMAVKRDAQQQRQEAQIERQEEEVIQHKHELGPLVVKKLKNDKFRISYGMPSVTDEPLADIIWMKKAAEVALKNKNPYFNVIEQIYRDAEVQGVIELENDPMKAEYDANEIMSLVVPELTD